jgi:cell division protein FtsI (penicillin-binding protein 3)
VGRPVNVGLPGEVSGSLDTARQWKPIERATLSFGYGASMTPLKLAHLYAVLARGGRNVALTIERRDVPVDGKRLFSQSVADNVIAMLEQVVAGGGTGERAQVPMYRVAGKTGTVKKIIDGRYAEKNYRSLFAGFAPASGPRLAIVVVIDDPRGKAYYGGQVAAPVFQGILSTALRLMNVAPDAPTPELHQTLVHNLQVGN